MPVTSSPDASSASEMAVVMIIATVMVMFLVSPEKASPSTKRVFIELSLRP